MKKIVVRHAEHFDLSPPTAPTMSLDFHHGIGGPWGLLFLLYGLKADKEPMRRALDVVWIARLLRSQRVEEKE
jgi:hypothetical protein